MSKDLLTRRKFGALGLASGSAFVLGGLSACDKKPEIVEVKVEERQGHPPRLVPIKAKVPKGTKKIRFVSVTPMWRFLATTEATSAWGTSPAFWFDGEDTPLIGTVSSDGLTCEITKVPASKQRLNVFFVMLGPRAPGDCGGGGDVEAE